MRTERGWTVKVVGTDGSVAAYTVTGAVTNRDAVWFAVREHRKPVAVAFAYREVSQ